MKPDLDSKANIKFFIDKFYEKVLKDDLLAPIFLDVAKIDIKVHKPIIRSYWEKLLLGENNYHRHTMNIHRRVHAKSPFGEKEFRRWLTLFKETAHEHFAGEKTDRAIKVATSIAFNMDVSLNNKGNLADIPVSERVFR